MILTLVGLSRGMLDEQIRRVRGVGADIIIRNPSSSVISMSLNMPAAMGRRIKELEPHVTTVAGVLLQGDMFNYVTGLDLTEFDKLNGGFRFVKGGPFQKPDDVIVDTYYAEQHNLHVGDTVTVLNLPWRVSGIFETGMLARMVIPLARMQDLTANTNKITILYVKLDDPARTDEVIADLKLKLKDYQIRSMQDYTELYSINSVPMLKEFIWVVIALGVLVGFLVVFLSMYTAVLERTREIVFRISSQLFDTILHHQRHPRHIDPGDRLRLVADHCGYRAAWRPPRSNLPGPESRAARCHRSPLL